LKAPLLAARIKIISMRSENGFTPSRKYVSFVALLRASLYVTPPENVMKAS
jgi:hypothetical protein